MDEYCIGCVHYYAHYAVNRMCNYIFDEKRRRPCDPGEGCTVRREKSPKKLGVSPQKEENIAYNEVYDSP
jgi:hypothetical protein